MEETGDQTSDLTIKDVTKVLKAALKAVHECQAIVKLYQNQQESKTQKDVSPNEDFSWTNLSDFDINANQQYTTTNLHNSDPNESLSNLLPPIIQHTDSLTKKSRNNGSSESATNMTPIANSSRITHNAPPPSKAATPTIPKQIKVDQFLPYKQFLLPYGM